jgi:hypothetical protein
MTTKYSKWTQNITSDDKIFQMTAKFANIFYSKAPKLYPNRDFWFGNIPSATLFAAQIRMCLTKNGT